MTFEIDFGLLSNPLAIDVGRIRIEPKSDFSTTVAAFTADLHKDGFFYPSPTWQVSLPDWPDTSVQVPVPQTERPAHLFTLSASHTLWIQDPVGERPALEDAAFIVQLIAYLYGTRLQVAGWQFDGRIPVKYSTHPTWVSQPALERFVPRAYNEWRLQPPERRLRLTNALYMHSKAPSYEWPWERFLIEYMVTDALFDYCQRTLLTTSVAHSDRIREMCNRAGIWCPPDAPIEAIVEMRNALFHSALWDNERPGYSVSSESYYRVSELRTLNQRLIAAVLGGMSEYTKIPWIDWRERTIFE